MKLQNFQQQHQLMPGYKTCTYRWPK